MFPQYGELRPTSGWDRSGSLGHLCKFQRVLRFGSVTARHSSIGRQPNFAALNRGRHLYLAGRPSRWALAHILVMSVCVIVNIEMTGSCLAVLAMAVVYEGLKAARQWLKEAAVNRRRSHQEDSGRETPVDDVPIILRTPSFFSGLVCWFYVMTNQCRASASTVYAISCSFISQTLALAIGVKVIFDHSHLSQKWQNTGREFLWKANRKSYAFLYWIITLLTDLWRFKMLKKSAYVFELNDSSSCLFTSHMLLIYKHFIISRISQKYIGADLMWWWGNVPHLILTNFFAVAEWAQFCISVSRTTKLYIVHEVYEIKRKNV